MRAVISAGCLGLLAGCGGGGGGGQSFLPSGAGYQTLASAEAVTSTLAAVALRTPEDVPEVAIARAVGTLRHDSGALSLQDDLFAFLSQGGPDAGGRWSDGARASLRTVELSGAPALDYAAVGEQIYAAAGQSFTLLGVYGIATEAGDMPGGGTGRFTGVATGAVTSPLGGGRLDGRARVTADFGAGSVDVTIDALRGSDPNSGLPAPLPIDEIRLRGMTISGTGYGGGTISTFDEGVALDLAGPGARQDSAGQFFGFDTGTGGPDETGGAFFREGNNTLVQGVFVAD